MMDVVHIERVELGTYQLKNVARIWFEQWKEGRDEDEPYPSYACFEEAFWGHFFPRETERTKGTRVPYSTTGLIEYS